MGRTFGSTKDKYTPELTVSSVSPSILMYRHRAHATCQKISTVHQRGRAHLHPLPVISFPFELITMDIMGLLEKSSAGHQYTFVITDYATIYPKAFLQLFSRLGIRDEIVKDQRTNFIPWLMGHLHQKLGISAIKTRPYHL